MQKLLTFLIFIAIATAAHAEPVKLTTVLNEGDTGFISVTFKDQNGVAVVPNTIKWWIDDEASGTNLVPPVTVVPTPAVNGTPGRTTYTIQIDECGQKIISNRATENRIMTLAFTYGYSIGTPGGPGTPVVGAGTPGPQSSNEYARYTVNNLPYLTVGGAYPNCAATPLVTPAATATATPTP